MNKLKLLESDWPAWIALAAAIMSPVVTILIDKLFQYLTLRASRVDAKKNAMSLLIADIAKASSCQVGHLPKLSEEGAKALVHCSPETCAAVIRYFGTWPEKNLATRDLEEPMYVFLEQGEKYAADTIQSASEKLIQAIRCESGRTKVQKWLAKASRQIRKKAPSESKQS